MIKSITSNLLISNYFLAQHSNGWKEERVFPSAVSLTSRQVYYLLMAVFLWFYPPLSSPGDVFYLFIFMGIMTYSILVAFRKSIFSLYESLNILKIVHLRTGSKVNTLFSMAVSGLGLLIFGITSAIKIVGYYQH